MNSVDFHRPVLLAEILDLARGAGRVVDCTFGGGGHSSALVEAGKEIIAIDRDPEALQHAARLGDRVLATLQGGFGDPAVLNQVAAHRPDFALLDLGVSSWQFDTDSRGFSFRPGVHLDMRMSGRQSTTAADVLNSASVEELSDLFREQADERRSRQLAREIVRRRETAAFEISDDLVGAIRAVLGPRSGPSDFARIFQALRIAVNDEMGQLEAGLAGLLDMLPAGGIIAVIAYHSGEDRIVKQRFAEWERDCVCPPRLPVCQCRGVSLGKRLNRKPIEASPEEIETNTRARSARLRAFAKAEAS